MDETALTRARDEMVRTQLVARDIVDPRVLAAMRTVPRHRFVPADLARSAHDDRPLPIGHGATISQPYVVAKMSELADIHPGDRVLDVGTGSGYQAAVLAELGAEVYGIEIEDALATGARAILRELGLVVDVVTGDGWRGRPEHAPYQAIIVAAAPPTVPAALIDQLALGGRLVIPVGERWSQSLQVITRTDGGTTTRDVFSVAFVPLVHGE